MPFDPTAPFEVLEPQTKEASGFDPTQPFEVIETPTGFDPSQPFEVDASTVGNQREVADGIADAISTALNMTSGIPKPLTNLLLRSGGKKTDIAINTLLPMAGGAVGTVAAPGVGTVAGGAAGGFAGESITELRQILRGERETFSPGSLIGTTAVSAVIPRPIRAAGSALATAGKTLLQRGAEGAALGGAQEAIREVIDEGGLSLGDIAENALWGSAFGTAFGGLEAAAPAVFKAIRGKPPKEAVKTLREDGTPPALAVADEIDAKLASGEVELPPPPDAGDVAIDKINQGIRDADAAQTFTAESVAKMTPDEFFEFSKEGGITNKAQVVGEATTDPKQIEYLAEQGRLANAEAKRLVQAEDFDTLNKVMVKEQFFNEAHQAATKSMPFATDAMATPEVGLGAASPKEFQPVEEFRTSLKQSVRDAERVARGEAPIEKELSKSLGESWDEGARIIDENQNAPDDLIASLKDKARALDDTDVSVLLQRKVDLTNQFNRASKNVRENIGTPDSLASDRLTKQRTIEDLRELEEAFSKAKAKTARGLNAIKLAAAQDYSLASMVEKVSAAKGDTKLTPDEILATEAAHQKIADAQRALDESTPDQININQAKLDQAKAEFNETLGRFRYEQLSTTRKFLSNAADTWDLIRNIYSSGEFSVVLRQGLLPLASRPITTAKAIPKSVKAFLSDEVMARKIDLDTLNSPDAAIAREAGVQLDEPGQKLGQREESIASEWAKKIPGLRNFNQFSRVFLNKVRVDNFKAMKNVRPDLTPDDLKLIAKYVNQATGRGSLGKFGNKNAAELNRLLFSARFQASRLQYLTGNSAWGGNGRTRAIIGREYARTLLGLAAMYSLYELGFSDEEGYQPVSFEPRSTNFGKLHFGPATIDPLAGLSQWIVFGTRTGLTLADSFGVDTGGQSINNKGELVSLRDPKGIQDSYGDVAERFARSKLHPLVGAVWSAHTGMDIMRQPTSWLQEAEKFKMPMTYEDILQAFQTMDVDQATAVSALAMLGMGLNVQQEKEGKQMGVARPEADTKKEVVRPAK